jgi:dissimilatory sulfite reductase (desulfoviridin) alpha/beta subunit
MMVRAKIPGGALTADQCPRFHDLATRYADGTLLVTTRQCFQLHHVLKRNLKRTIREINDALIRRPPPEPWSAASLRACSSSACPADPPRTVLPTRRSAPQG